MWPWFYWSFLKWHYATSYSRMLFQAHFMEKSCLQLMVTIRNYLKPVSLKFSTLNYFSWIHEFLLCVSFFFFFPLSFSCSVVIMRVCCLLEIANRKNNWILVATHLLFSHISLSFIILPSKHLPKQAGRFSVEHSHKVLSGYERLFIYGCSQAFKDIL